MTNVFEKLTCNGEVFFSHLIQGFNKAGGSVDFGNKGRFQVSGVSKGSENSDFSFDRLDLF